MIEPWMPGIERIETAAFGGRPYGVTDGEMHAEAVVNHVMEGWLSTMIAWAHERPFHHDKGYHFGLGVDGRIVQFSPIDTPAWHAGRRDDGKGGNPLAPPTWPLHDDSPINAGGRTVAIAREGMSAQPWTPEQLDASVRITTWVLAQHGLKPTPETIIGHSELNPATRAHDPGGGWDKNEIIAALLPPLLPPTLTRSQRMWAVFSNGSVPMRVDGEYGVYEFRRRIP